QKSKSENCADDAAIGERMQVIIMRLLELVHFVTRIESRVYHTERSETRTENRIRLDDVQRNAPIMRSPSGGIRGIRCAEQTIEDIGASKRDRAHDQSDDHSKRQPSANDYRANSLRFFLALTPYAESSDHYQKQNLSAQTDDAAARI